MERREIPPLTSPRSDRVKAVRALSRRSVRDRERLFLAEGPQCVREAIACRPEVVDVVYVGDAALDGGTREPSGVVAALREAAYDAGLRVQPVTADVLATMADTRTPQGIAAVCRYVDVPFDEARTAAYGYLCVLAHVRDPGNAGTVLRAADAAGAGAVVITSESVDLYNPKLVRSTAGSIFHLPIVRDVPIRAVVSGLRADGVAVLAADGAGDVLVHEADLGRRHAWVMGNEAWGLPEELRALCDEVVRVPIYGRAESLNLATAATVCLYASAATWHQRTNAPG